jgi:hypothetical protein
MKFSPEPRLTANKRELVYIFANNFTPQVFREVSSSGDQYSYTSIILVHETKFDKFSLGSTLVLKVTYAGF